MKHLPMGQMPILEIGDGKVYHQSKAISRFVAKKGNLYGSDDVEAMEIDAIVDTIDDMRIGKNNKCFTSVENNEQNTILCNLTETHTNARRLLFLVTIPTRLLEE